MLELVLKWYGAARYTDESSVTRVQANSAGNRYAYTMTTTNKRTNTSSKRKYYTFAQLESDLHNVHVSVTEGWAGCN